MTNIFDKIKATADAILKPVSKTIDDLHVSDDEKASKKNELTQIVLGNLTSLAQAQADVLKTEMSGNFLQRSWRPIIMLTFGAICVIAVFYDVKLNAIPAEFWDLLKIGIGGYVAGRSIEKVAGTVTQNVDMTFLKKKDRKSNIKDDIQ